MAEIIKTYMEHLPALRFIGKCYTNKDRGNDGSYSGKWGEWFQNGWFGELEKLGEAENIENGYLGFMRCNGSDFENSFEYWIGIFFPPNTDVPEGYDYIDLEDGDVGVCFIKGNEHDGSIYNMHDACMKKLQEYGMDKYKDDAHNRVCFFERYNCPRFTEKDENGDVILDYGIYLAN